MRRIRSTAIWGLLLALGAVTMTPVQAAHNAFDLRAQLALLMQWWPGEYDNHEQIVRQSGGGLSPLTDTPFYRVHSRYERITGSSLGEHVISAVDYRDDDPAKVLRVRSYVLGVDVAAGALRIRQFAPKAPGSNELVSLGAACDILLNFVGGQFEGQLNKGACTAAGHPAEFGLVVGSRYNWFREKAGQTWFEQTRARRFICTVHENAAGDMPKTKYYKTIRLHDQGGEADIPWPDGRILTFTIHARAFSSPPEREYPLFRIHEKGKAIPIAYAYAVDDTARFGLNLGWFYVRCYAEGEDMGADAAYK
jgi:hypothetical protein